VKRICSEIKSNHGRLVDIVMRWPSLGVPPSFKYVCTQTPLRHYLSVHEHPDPSHQR